MTETLASDGDQTPAAEESGEVPFASQDGDAIGAAVGAAMADDMANRAPAVPGAYRVMDIEDVSLELPNQYPSVRLVESEPPMRTLEFPLGLAEGTALALAIRRMRSPRPMTHELFIDVLQRVRIDVIAVRLIGREKGNLLAELDLMTPQGRERVPCRPSDGLIMATRMPVSSPILVDERLLLTSADVRPEDD